MFLLTVSTPVVVATRTQNGKAIPTEWQTVTGEFEFENLGQACEMARRSLRRGVKLSLVCEATGTVLVTNEGMNINDTKKAIKALATQPQAVAQDEPQVEDMPGFALPCAATARVASLVQVDASAWGKAPGQLRVVRPLPPADAELLAELSGAQDICNQLLTTASSDVINCLLKHCTLERRQSHGSLHLSHTRIQRRSLLKEDRRMVSSPLARRRTPRIWAHDAPGCAYCKPGSQGERGTGPPLQDLVLPRLRRYGRERSDFPWYYRGNL